MLSTIVTLNLVLVLDVCSIYEPRAAVDNGQVLLLVLLRSSTTNKNGTSVFYHQPRPETNIEKILSEAQY